MLDDLGAIERHIEEEPQRRDGGVDLWRTRAARRQMQPKAAHVFRLSRVGRAAEERRKTLDPLNVVVLRLRREIANRHVFDHAPAQRANALIGHGILLSEPRLLTPRSSDRSIRPVTVWPLPCRRRKRPTARAVSFIDPERTSERGRA